MAKVMIAKTKLSDEAKNAMIQLTGGTNTGLVDVLTYPLWATMVLVAGQDEYTPFATSKAENSNDASITNVQVGGRVPSKQAFDVSGVKIEITSDTALTDAIVGELFNFLSRSVMTLQIDDSPKFEITLSQMLGASTLIQAVGTVGNSNLNSLFAGKFKLDQKIYMGAETQYEFKVRNYGTTVPANLADIRIKFTLDRELIRLV